MMLVVVAFQCYDIDGDGIISESDLFHVVCSFIHHVHVCVVWCGVVVSVSLSVLVSSVSVS